MSAPSEIKLEYAAPSRMKTPPLPLVVLNVATAVVSLCLLPLAVHIYSCDAGVKWCHFQALVFGTPVGLAIFFLGALSAPWLISKKSPGLRTRLLVEVPLALASTVLVLLVAAVIVND